MGEVGGCWGQVAQITDKLGDTQITVACTVLTVWYLGRTDYSDHGGYTASRQRMSEESIASYSQGRPEQRGLSPAGQPHALGQISILLLG